MIKYKINGIVTIPAGIAQQEELKIDSPTIELIAGDQKGNGTAGQANINLGIRYTYMQGSIKKERIINRPFDWSELSSEQQAIIGQMVQHSWGLIFSLPDHAKAELVNE